MHKTLTIHTHVHTHTYTLYTRICTCVGWFPVPLLTLLLHTTWPFYWTLTLVYYTQRSTTMFIFTIHNTDVLYICNCNACCFQFVVAPLGPVRVRFKISWLTIFNDMPSRYRYVVLKTVASWEIIGSEFCRKGPSSHSCEIEKLTVLCNILYLL